MSESSRLKVASLRTLGFSVVFLLLSGCASLVKISPDETVIVDKTKHYRQLVRLKSWKLEGKLGYQGQQQSGSAFLQWQQQQQDFELLLSGPLGIKTTRISGNGKYAELQQAGMTQYTATSAAELTSRLFGWTWPVDELLYWIKGIPSPDSEAMQKVFNEQGLLAELSQSQWQLKFSNYQPIRDLVLPGKITGSRDDLRFTLIIKNWQLD